jgi:hypothetical protein
MQSPEGRRLLPSTAEYLHGEIEKVREDALDSVADLTTKLPARSRFSKDIVPVLAKPSASFNKKELNNYKACGVPGWRYWFLPACGETQSQQDIYIRGRSRASL